MSKIRHRAAVAATLFTVLALGFAAGSSVDRAEAGNFQIWQTTPNNNLPTLPNPGYVAGKCPTGFQGMNFQGQYGQQNSSYECVSSQLLCAPGTEYKVAMGSGYPPHFDGQRFRFACRISPVIY